MVCVWVGSPVVQMAVAVTEQAVDVVDVGLLPLAALAAVLVPDEVHAGAHGQVVVVPQVGVVAPQTHGQTQVQEVGGHGDIASPCTSTTGNRVG